MNTKTPKPLAEDDAIPESGVVEGFQHPRFTPECRGHEEEESEVLSAYNSNRLHHAWLLTGPEGIGKATLAFRIARFLLSRSPDSEQANSLDIPAENTVGAQIAALSHPNFLLLRRPWMAERKRLATVLTISEIRKLRHFLGRTAGEGRWRVVIIDQADELNTAAANALLKNLEEPPVRCVFLLVCSAPGKLPVTIRSRCRKLALAPLGNADLEAAISEAHAASGLERPSEADMKAVLPLAQGSVGRALRLLQGNGVDLHAQILSLLEGLPTLDHAGAHAFAEQLASDRTNESYALFFDLLGDTLSRIVTSAATGTVGNEMEERIAARIGNARALAQFSQLWETVQRTTAEADVYNLDRKNHVLGTFFKLEETAQLAMR